MRRNSSPHLQEFRNRFQLPPAEATFRPDCKVAEVFLRDVDATARALDTIGIMHKPERQARLRPQL
jgi:hypothetical protein